jgi:hypothetical protein
MNVSVKKKQLFDLVNCTLTALDELDSLQKKNKPKKVKRLWVRQWVSERPDEVGLYRQLQIEDPAKFFANFRMSPAVFEELLDRYINSCEMKREL